MINGKRMEQKVVGQRSFFVEFVACPQFVWIGSLWIFPQFHNVQYI